MRLVAIADTHCRWDALEPLPGGDVLIETAGFRCVRSAVVMQVTAPTWSAYADKLTAGGDSVLARLAEDELARGLEAVHQYANLRDTHREPVVEPIDIFFFR